MLFEKCSLSYLRNTRTMLRLYFHVFYVMHQLVRVLTFDLDHERLRLLARCHTEPEMRRRRLLLSSSVWRSIKDPLIQN